MGMRQIQHSEFSITIKLFLPTNYPDMGVWYATIATTLILNVDGVWPTSSSFCRKDKLEATSQGKRSSFQTLHQLEKIDRLRA